MNIKLAHGWHVLQDVHDRGETCQIYEEPYHNVNPASSLSEWEPIDYLGHLQPYFANNPYYGRELRYFNNAPWWYKNVFDVPDADAFDCCAIRFEGVDYYCKVWINGEYAGEHEGYGTPFEIQAGTRLRTGSNTLVVKVWSPWDDAILPGMEDRRTFHVVRGMMKGTYEHDDTLIQRDVNPVGIYGDVTVMLGKSARLAGSPQVYYATMQGKGMCGLAIDSAAARDAELRATIHEWDSGVLAASVSVPLRLAAGANDVRFAFEVADAQVWHTWDRGGPFLYEMRVALAANGAALDSGTVRFGFRDAAMIRNDRETALLLNGKRIFLRGTCYLPELYLSEMSRERYKRDMELAVSLGFNAIRVHVHTAKRCLYDLCDEMGIAVVQDSDFNWTHDDSDDFARRSAVIFKEMIDHLRSHPSILSWICMNEPDFIKDRRQVDGNPGPQLWEAVCAADPWRPAIKASYLPDDPDSGDTHTYAGSLEDETSHYTSIDDVPEKLNTEFGIDAPPGIANLRREKKIWHRLKAIEPEIERVQYYQYRLIKHYVEHYRTSKYAPCAGFFHFMLNDLSPQSYYGIYDWWGMPKKCADAFAESNGPIGVFLKKSGNGYDMLLVNDSDETLEALDVSWRIVGPGGVSLAGGQIRVGAAVDSIQTIARLADERLAAGESYVAVLTVRSRTGKMLARNRYDDLTQHPPRPAGHPRRMSHELGVRLFHA